MSNLQLSDVQATNLQLLYAIRLGIERDLVDTCRKFFLTPDQAERLRVIPPEGLWPLVHALGDTSLFVPRCDLVTLVDVPAALAGMLAAAHPPCPTPGQRA